MQRRWTTQSPMAGRWRRRRIGALIAALGLACAGAIGFGSARGQNGFPFGRELIMDVAPIKGTKRLPTLDIADDGLAEIRLFCAIVKARLIVVADTITIIAGPKDGRSCPPEHEKSDDETLAALSQVSNWRMEDDMLVLSGAPNELRFRTQTN
jgi:hypothetical protein